MYRNVIDELAAWYETDQQVLLIKGARGVGKTWTALDFAGAFFERSIVVDFENETDFLKFFQGSVDADKIEGKLRSRLERKNQEKLSFEKGTLLIFDEVQLLKMPLPGIMAYAMQRPEIRICIIASWMGELEGEDFYDNLTMIRMYPMTFEEFLTANKAQHLCKYIERQKMEVVEPKVKEEMKAFLQCFMATGGMPEVVADFVKYKSFAHTDMILTKQLSDLRNFIKQTAPRALERKVLQIWDSIPTQLTKDNRKFMYGYVDEKARAREYEPSVAWLASTGLVRQVYRVTDGTASLAEHIDRKAFELYHLDHGLLRVMCGCTLEQLEEGNDIYQVLSGVLTEQYVLAELTLNVNVNTLYFWISGATAKVDFVFEDDGEVIPVDVQSIVRRQAQTLKVFYKKYNNRMAIRISLEDLNFSKGILNIPLYGLWNF